MEHTISIPDDLSDLDLVSRGGIVYRCLIAHGAEYAGTWGPPATGVWESVV